MRSFTDSYNTNYLVSKLIDTVIKSIGVSKRISISDKPSKPTKKDSSISISTPKIDPIELSAEDSSA
jgi:hypothetical protein